MTSLFPSEPIMPYGFSYFTDFISEEEEQRILDVVSTFELHTLVFRGFEAKRNVESFGFNYHFDSRTISKGKEMPEGLRFIIERVANWLLLPVAEISQILVTEYPQGSVINWHRDAPPFDIIIGLSLLSDCSFKLRPYDKTKQGRTSIISKIIARRSLYILKDEARTDWEHSIAPVKNIRYSLTFRTLRNK